MNTNFITKALLTVTFLASAGSASAFIRSELPAEPGTSYLLAISERLETKDASGLKLEGLVPSKEMDTQECEVENVFEMPLN